MWGGGWIHSLWNIIRILLCTSPVKHLMHEDLACILTSTMSSCMMFTKDAYDLLFPCSLCTKEKTELATLYNVLDVKDRLSLTTHAHEVTMAQNSLLW